MGRVKTRPEVILANPTQPEQFFYEPEQPEEIFLLTRKIFFHKCDQI